MLDRFTEEARQALIKAQQAARSLRYDSLDSGTLLLGLLTDHTDAAIRALAQQGINFDVVREEMLARRRPVFRTEQKGAVPYTAESMALIDTAARESKKLGHKGVLTSGHLVLAMVRTPESVAAQTMLALGADLRMIELAVAAGHVPSLPEPAVELPDEFRRMLVQQAGLDWPRPRPHLISTVVNVLWYLGTLAILVVASQHTAGPELVVGLAAVGLLWVAVLHLIMIRRVRIPAPVNSSLMPSPPELMALVARWGISDFAIWLRDDYHLDDHAVRIRAKARIGVSREVFNRPAESGFVVAHELAHLLRNDSMRSVIDRWLRRSFLLPAAITLDPWIWAIIAASLVLHALVKNWEAEFASDLIAVKLHGHEQMASFANRTHVAKGWPSRTHPPYAWRMWLASKRIPHLV
ncbi:Clp protease N-terminal domain-containing protein [Rhizocola hellebori]|nr:Clp protease N-terminal domain-containing protein [Rhizocola hellebori]